MTTRVVLALALGVLTAIGPSGGHLHAHGNP